MTKVCRLECNRAASRKDHRDLQRLAVFSLICTSEDMEGNYLGVRKEIDTAENGISDEN